MNKFLCTAFAILTACPLAHAEDLYVGANVGQRSDGRIRWTDGGATTEREASRRATPVGVFAGYVLSPTLALEAGYRGDSGSTGFDLAPGYQLKARSSVAYLAARGTAQLSDDWSVFGKAGVARGRAKLSISGEGGREAETMSRTGAYLSLGVSYRVVDDVALQLELEHTDTLKREGLTAKMDRVSLGLRIGF
jgi:OOP family OmpA-OmpF porin